MATTAKRQGKFLGNKPAAPTAKLDGPIAPPARGTVLFDSLDLVPYKALEDNLSRATFAAVLGLKVNGAGPKAIERMLRVIAETGIVGLGAMAIGWTRDQLAAARRTHPALDHAVGEAIEIHTDFVERVIRDRVIHGVPQPVTFKGQLIGWSRYYSDRLAELYIRAKRPREFVEKVRHEHSKSIQVNDRQELVGDPANLSADEKIQLVKLMGKLQGLEPVATKPPPKRVTRDVGG